MAAVNFRPRSAAMALPTRVTSNAKTKLGVHTIVQAAARVTASKSIRHDPTR
jgi:hypothetical protein